MVIEFVLRLGSISFGIELITKKSFYDSSFAEDVAQMAYLRRDVK